MTAINDRRSAMSTPPLVLESTPTWQRAYARWLVGTDLTAVLLALGLAQIIRFGDWSGTVYLDVSAGIAIAWMTALWINRSRSERVIGAGAEEYRRVWQGTFSVFGGVAIFCLLFKVQIARGYLLVALPIGLMFLIAFRWIARRLIARARVQQGLFITRVLAVGNIAAVRDLATALAREPWSGFEVVGAFIPGSGGQRMIKVDGVAEVATFGSESSVIGAVAATNCQAVAVTTTEQLDARWIRDLSWELERVDIDLLVSPGVVDIAGPRLHMRPVATGMPLVHVEKPRYHGAKRFQKRLFDIVFSSLILLIGSPLLLAIALAVKLTSEGPVFYRQQRIGLDGEPFMMLKFRTMIDGADGLCQDIANLDLVGSPRDAFKFVDDPRVTPVGRLLRKYSLDELPQFINVLRREMSIVGPRPQVDREVEAYDDNAKRRLLVRPGITGLWQVSGRSNLSWEDSVRLDLYYVENWSIMADMVIAIRTAKAVLSHTGAY
jgi:exopolysaccharide biosynthesis polyprenyl glycosylphosphotransferase